MLTTEMSYYVVVVLQWLVGHTQTHTRTQTDEDKSITLTYYRLCTVDDRFSQLPLETQQIGGWLGFPVPHLFWYLRYCTVQTPRHGPSLAQELFHCLERQNGNRVQSLWSVLLSGYFKVFLHVTFLAVTCPFLPPLKHCAYGDDVNNG